jgi:hypothetical protein
MSKEGRMSDAHQKEVDRNYAEFQNLLPSIIGQHFNQFALMKNGQILAFFSTAVDARIAASTFIQDGVYSIQQVSSATIDLGFYNYAVPVN